MLYTAVQQHKSAIIIHIFPPLWGPLPSPHPAPLDRHRAPGWAPGITQQLPVGYLFYIWSFICVSGAFSMYPSLSSLRWIHKSIFHVCISISRSTFFDGCLFSSFQSLYVGLSSVTVLGLFSVLTPLQAPENFYIPNTSHFIPLPASFLSGLTRQLPSQQFSIWIS